MDSTNSTTSANSRPQVRQKQNRLSALLHRMNSCPRNADPASLASESPRASLESVDTVDELKCPEASTRHESTPKPRERDWTRAMDMLASGYGASLPDARYIGAVSAPRPARDRAPAARGRRQGSISSMDRLAAGLGAWVPER